MVEQKIRDNMPKIIGIMVPVVIGLLIWAFNMADTSTRHDERIETLKEDVAENKIILKEINNNVNAIMLNLARLTKNGRQHND